MGAMLPFADFACNIFPDSGLHVFKKLVARFITGEMSRLFKLRYLVLFNFFNIGKFPPGIFFKFDEAFLPFIKTPFMPLNTFTPAPEVLFGITAEPQCFIFGFHNNFPTSRLSNTELGLCVFNFLAGDYGDRWERCGRRQRIHLRRFLGTQTGLLYRFLFKTPSGFSGFY